MRSYRQQMKNRLKGLHMWREAIRLAGQCEALDKNGDYAETAKRLHWLWKRYRYYCAAGILGYYYYKGLGVRRNARRGFYFSKLAMRDHEDAILIHNVAVSYLDGDGVAQNLKRGWRLQNRAIRLGYEVK